MYVIAIYDVESKRTSKMLKLCRRYLHWIQNSVFEGELSEARLRELESESKEVLNLETDSFIIFKMTHTYRIDKRIIGRERSSTDAFL